VSDFRAIAAVTATLQRTLQEAIQGDVSGATVTTVRPAEGENTNLPDTGINVFLYQITPNPHWRNGDLPTRRPDGSLAQRPQAAVDLHYLFSFYGGDVALEPQRLLGSTLAFLHSQPLLTREQIEAAVSDPAKPFLAGADLAEQVDLVRFAPLSLSLEDFSRLWSVFFQIRYVLSTAFRASVVLIEPQLEPAPALPTRAYEVSVEVMRRLSVERVVAATGDDDSILAGSTIRAEGEGLRADVMRVEIDGEAVAVDEVLPRGIVTTLPAGLAAGAHNLVVRHGVAVGAPGVPHFAFASNPAAFVVQPRITGIEVAAGAIMLEVDPAVGATQLVTLELLAAAGVVRTIRGTEGLVFPHAGVAPGTYVARVRVDGAASPVETDENGVPTGPEVTVP
jgi:hypothetical protein